MSSEEEEKRDWSELPAELLHLIAQKLPDLVDLIRLRVVCTVWRSSAPLSDPPHQLPWLLELSHSISALRRKQRFYSLSSGETLTIPLKHKKQLCNFIRGGVYSGYLPFDDYLERTLSFFNPLTWDSFSLPLLFHRRSFSPWMVWTGTDPIRNRTIVVVDRNMRIANQVGKWALYDPSSNTCVENEGYFYQCCYWNRLFFSTNVHEPTQVFDAHSKELLQEIPPPEIESKENWSDEDNIARQLRKSYLVVSSGVILRVIWRHELVYGDKIPIEESVFYIYRLDFKRASGKSCWVRIGDIGDQILFLGEMNGFSMTARPNSRFRKGCIYFIYSKTNKPYMHDILAGTSCWVRIGDIGDQILFLGEMNGFSMTARPNSRFRKGCIYFIYSKTNKPYMHDILAGTVERVPCPFEECTWFLPGL
ncbi:F-box SKIP23-like protein (DUF295) [Rhynchospora pubera]|uniref:F-box SKIP23-like protein (DUF295) n=1 Tax=Rhynchospora pubera TaxID=906938 RepID=A0AAV8ESQ5_9POAL|nr:F-box SKIP23-like protein (DUF295) [Rhynchospora pubera]